MQRRGNQQAARRECSRRVEEYLPALLDPIRLLIIAVLAEGCRRFIELQRLLGITKGRLYFHINVLEKNCIIEKHYRLSSSDRPALYICLTPDASTRLPRVLDNLIERLEQIRNALSHKETGQENNIIEPGTGGERENQPNSGI